MSVQPAGAERRVCSPSAVPAAAAAAAAAAAPYGARAVRRGDGRALRLVRSADARLAAPQHGTQRRGDASRQTFPDACAAIEGVRRDAAGPGVRTSFVHADACGGTPPVEIDASAAHPLEHVS
ncbi:TPA: endoribonuclease L-PSP [Burkholderia vietnamiensis]|nr:endoribonuclease L-PSP [Burkholderia vietnamiensis]